MKLDISHEELLKLLNEEQDQTPKKKKPKDRKDVMMFIRHFQIEQGQTRVSTDLIYYNFIKWTKVSWARKTSKIDFFKTFSKYFTQVRTGKQRYYLINDVLDTSEETERMAVRYNQREYDKKKQDKVSSTGRNEES